MMPPEQENSGGSATNISEQIELPMSTSNVSPCPEDDQMPQRDHSTLAPFSVLRQTLHPVTLKVLYYFI